MSTYRTSRPTPIAASRSSVAVSDRQRIPLAKLAEGGNSPEDGMSNKGGVGPRQGTPAYTGQPRSGQTDEVPVNSGHQMTRIPKVDQWQNSLHPSTVVNRQPGPLSWIPHQLDPISKELFEDIASTHTSNGKFRFVIMNELEHSSKAMEQGRSWMPETVFSYGEFLTDLLYPDECYLVRGQSVPFTNVIFHVCEEWVPEPHRWGTHKALRPPAKKQMLTGRAFLTNHRLIFLSAEKQNSISLTRFQAQPQDTGTKKPVGYQFRATNQDTVNFQSIPLTHFRNVEMLVAAGSSYVTNIMGQRLLCCLPTMGCCRVCYEDDMCSKHWYTRDKLTFAINTRTISMGVVLPPWGNRSILEMHIQPDVPLSLMKEFVVDLQRYTPGLRSIAQKPQERD